MYYALYSSIQDHVIKYILFDIHNWGLELWKYFLREKYLNHNVQLDTRIKPQLSKM